MGVSSMKSMINEVSERNNSMINERKKPKSKLVGLTEAEYGADRLVRKLNAPECRQFFCKVMYYLPANQREIILEYATSGAVKSPKHYFTASAKRELLKLGIA